MSSGATTSNSAASTIRDYVDANGVHTYYEVHGAGDPLLLLHGGACPIETFGGLTPRLAERHRVHLPERRAHGRTADVEGPFTYDLLMQDTVAYMDAVGLTSADVVGWSDGATIGLLMAIHHPGRVRRLVLIGQHGRYEGVRPEILGMLEQETMPGLPPMLRELYEAVSPDGPGHWDAAIAKIWQMIRTAPDIPPTDLARVTAPTLVVIAEQDFATVEYAEAMQRALPHGWLTVVSGATHGLPMEQPDVVADLVLDFLASDRPSSATA